MNQISYSNNGNFLKTAVPQRELEHQMSIGTAEENGTRDDIPADSLGIMEKVSESREQVRRQIVTKVVIEGIGGMHNKIAEENTAGNSIPSGSDSQNLTAGDSQKYGRLRGEILINEIDSKSKAT